MNNKKLIIIFVSILILIIILFVVSLKMLNGESISPFNTYKTPTVDAEYEKKVQDVESGKITGKYETSEKNEEYYNLDQNDRNELDEKIDTVIALVNSKNISKIYSFFTEEYKNARFPSEEELSIYLDEELKNNSKFVVKSFKVSRNKTNINVELESGDSNIKVIQISKEDNSGESKDNIYFGDFFSISGLNAYYVDEQFRMETYETIHYTKSNSIILRITNLSDVDLKFNLNDSKLVYSFSGIDVENDLLAKSEFTVPKDSDRYIEIEFEQTEVFPRSIKIQGTVNGREISYDYYLHDMDLDIE